ncbi:discoidin domain-containing protein [Paenibacillus sp. FJAT-26967]|uniref:discoidin domain-containing protein n=1 Tax=Paenibacillus sp. FJAT-26967 TaxID=1729690 RepID=UPI0008392889|nr:discoidin domain-containing protein [Paenibacillus sp. FJAT-26967]
MEKVFNNPSYNYLDCRKIQVFNYLAANGIDLNVFFYNAWENAKEVHEEIITKKQRKWSYEPNVGGNWADFGIETVKVAYQQFEDVIPLVNELIERKQDVFIWLDAHYIDHRKLDPLLHHSLAIKGYEEKDSFLLDDIPVKQGVISPVSRIHDGCNYSRRKYITYYDLHNYELSETTMIQNRAKLKLHIESIDHDFNFYESIFVRLTDVHPNEAIELIPYMDDALSIIAGSRFLFARYLMTDGVLSELFGDLISHYIKTIELLKIMLLKASITKKLDSEGLSACCKKLSSMESDLVQRLKLETTSDVSGWRSTFDGTREIFSPEQLETVASSDTSIKIRWKESADIWTNSYDIYLDGAFLDNTKGCSYTFSNLIPDRSYSVSVSSRDALGNKSEEQATMLAETKWDTKNEDLAVNRPVYSSSDENLLYNKDNVTDGNQDTRWSSLCDDSQWIYIDLGGVTNFNSVILKWEDAHAASYHLDVSNDGVNWTTIYTNLDCKGKTEILHFETQQQRYVRMSGIKRATEYGYSLWTFSVWNKK